MERDEIVDNVTAALNGAVGFVPKKLAGVRSFHLKFSDSVALPLFRSLPDVKLRILGKKDEVVEGVDEVMEIVEVGKKSKSKKRIHEVNHHDDGEVENEDSISVDDDVVKSSMKKRKGGEVVMGKKKVSNKAPNATNSLCGYKIVTGQPSDRLGEDFTEFNKDFTERLTCVEDLTKATMKKLTQGMGQQNKTAGAAISDEEKAKNKIQKQNATTGLRPCNNILAMTQPLHSKAPSFIGDKRINLSWNEAVKVKTVTPPNAAGGKRPANNLNGSGNHQANKRGRGGSNQLVDRAFESISHGGGRGGSRGGGQGRGFGRGRGGGYYR